MAPDEIRQLFFRPIPPPLTELDITYPDGIYLGEPVPHDERMVTQRIGFTPMPSSRFFLNT